MSTKHCPSCGSAVDDDVTICPVCGEDLAAAFQSSREEAPAPAPRGPVAAAGAPASEAAPEPEPTRVVCPECGAPNPLGSAECSNCGASLANIDARKHRTSASAGDAKSVSLQTYLIAGLAMLVIALIIYIVSTPEQKPAPPASMGSAQGGALPEGHPPVDQGAQMEALNKRVADLEAQVAAKPDDDTLRLQLANALYDAQRFADAKPHYEKYVTAHPQDLDARTDYATATAAAGDVDAAIVALNKVLGEDPKHQRAAFNMAIMYRVKGGHDSTGADPKTMVYRDSVMHWLRRVVEIDSTTPTGKGALDILQTFEQEIAGDTSRPSIR